MLPAGVWEVVLDSTHPRGLASWHGQGEVALPCPPAACCCSPRQARTSSCSAAHTAITVHSPPCSAVPATPDHHLLRGVVGAVLAAGAGELRLPRPGRCHGRNDGRWRTVRGHGPGATVLCHQHSAAAASPSRWSAACRVAADGRASACDALGARCRRSRSAARRVCTRSASAAGPTLPRHAQTPRLTPSVD